MHHIIRIKSAARSERASMVADAIGMLALFALTYAALHLPMFA